MKRTCIGLMALFIGISTGLNAQNPVKIKTKNDQVFVNGQHEFDIIMVGFVQEVIVKDKTGEIVYDLLQMQIPTGYSSNSRVDSRGRFSSDSGTNYTYYFKMADVAGNQCEIGYMALQNRRSIAKYLLDNNLMKNGMADAEQFIKFCNMHGNSYSGGR